MNCHCRELINQKLESKNLRLVGYAYTFDEEEGSSFWGCSPWIKTEWIDDSKAPRGQKRNPPHMFASHCPFCGVPVKRVKKGAR